MADSPTTPSGSHTTNASRHARILACVLCQHRKIKCDRNSPCSNCLKANVPCTPSTPAPARKRRRPNQDLQERLARCEDLLRQYAGGTAPGQSQPNATPASPTQMDGTPDSSTVSPVSSPDVYLKWKPTGKMIKEEGGVRFMDSYLWASVYDELQAMRGIVETEEPEEASVLGSEELTPENHTDLFFPYESATMNLDALQPDAVHSFRLWQLFLDRVNPVTKVIHVPTLQPYVMDAAAGMSNIPLNFQALLFAIYTMATVSLTDAECCQLLGISRQVALRRFTTGTKMALSRFDFMKNFDMAVLSALLLLLLSLQGRYDRHAAWILSGTIVRIGQKMGYHRDGEILGLSPFETEMRRRIWWQIVIQDAKQAMLSGLSHALVPLNWDTKEPQNINDADLFQGLTDPVQPREGPTEMAFCLVIYQITKFMVHAESGHGTVGFEAAVLGQELDAQGSQPALTNEKSIQKYRSLIMDLVNNLARIEGRYVDAAAGKVHVAALSIRPMLKGKLMEMLTPMLEQPEWGTEIFGPKDNLFKIVMMNNEHNVENYELMAENGFLWFAKLHFQLDVFSVMTGQLYSRPTGQLADRAWRNIAMTYKFHRELYDMSQKPFAVQAQFTLRAWRARERAFAQAGLPLDEPLFIKQLRDVSPSERVSTAHSTAATPPQPQQPNPMVQISLPQRSNAPHQTAMQPQSATETEPMMGSDLDGVSALNWDVWGTMSFGDNTNAAPMSWTPATFGGYGLNSLADIDGFDNFK